MSDVPSWWEAVLLTLAVYRVWRLLAADTILDKPRDRLVKAADKDYREELDIFLHCPWCLGFWLSVLGWAAWLVFPTETIWVSVPLAISTVVGFMAKADQ
jgi:Protein of unknown function (DUF1360)